MPRKKSEKNSKKKRRMPRPLAGLNKDAGPIFRVPRSTIYILSFIGICLIAIVSLELYGGYILNFSQEEIIRLDTELLKKKIDIVEPRPPWFNNDVTIAQTGVVGNRKEEDSKWESSVPYLTHTVRGISIFFFFALRSM